MATSSRHGGGESIAEHEAAMPKCPKCEGDKVVRVYSRVYAKSSKKS